MQAEKASVQPEATIISTKQLCSHKKVKSEYLKTKTLTQTWQNEVRRWLSVSSSDVCACLICTSMRTSHLHLHRSSRGSISPTIHLCSSYFLRSQSGDLFKRIRGLGLASSPQTLPFSLSQPLLWLRRGIDAASDPDDQSFSQWFIHYWSTSVSLHRPFPSPVPCFHLFTQNSRFVCRASSPLNYFSFQSVWMWTRAWICLNRLLNGFLLVGSKNPQTNRVFNAVCQKHLEMGEKRFVHSF